MKCIVLKLGLLLDHHVCPRAGYVILNCETVMTFSSQQLPKFLSLRYCQKLADHCSEAVCIDMLGFTYALCLCILSGHRWLHLVPLQNSNGLSGKRKLVHELAEPLGRIQPALEIENRAFTLLTLP